LTFLPTNNEENQLESNLEAYNTTKMSAQSTEATTELEKVPEQVPTEVIIICLCITQMSDYRHRLPKRKRKRIKRRKQVHLYSSKVIIH
jgi:hypothetical protein